MEIFSIGVYGYTEAEFFDKIRQHNIDLFCDIRLRRAVRGSKYTFVNSTRLQDLLKKLNIGYKHLKFLAPSKEIRNLQKEADLDTGISKRSRLELGLKFSEFYLKENLSASHIDELITFLNNSGAQRIAFFCVENPHTACHRTLVLSTLQNLGYRITHI